MSHQYSLGFLTVGNLEASAQIYTAARAGYDYVGLRPIPMGLPGEPALDLAADPVLLANAKQALADTGVGVWDIELARVLDDVDYDTYAPALEIGAELGAQVVLTSVWTADRAKQEDGLGRVAELAGQHGLKVVAEFVPLSQVKTLAEMAGLVQAVGASNLGVLLDMYHWHRAQTGLTEVDQYPAEWFPMIHLCDCPGELPANAEALREEVRERRLYTGEGDVPIADLVKRLPDDLVFSIEQPHLERLRVLGDTEFAARSLANARRYFEAHGIN